MVQNVHMLGKYNNRGLSSNTQPVVSYKWNRTRAFQRLLVFGLALMALLSFSGLASAFLVNKDAYAASTQPAKQTVVYVEQGDTLWSIAQEHVAKGEDVRDYIYSIRKLNGLKDATLHVGQKIILPATR